MISYTKAQHILKTHARPFGDETIPIDEACGRVLAENILADRDYPPFNRAAMDGYAIHSSDWEKGVREYKIAETIFAGCAHSIDLEPGSCYKIMTGAAVPASANAIIRNEDADEFPNCLVLKTDQVNKFQNIAKQGEDVKINELILSANRICNPQVNSMLASVGKSNVLVKKLPQTALFTTGNEIVAINSVVSDLQIRNSNQYLLKALLKKWQINPAVCKHIADDKRLLKSEINQALSADIMILCGGVSVGEADYVPDVLTDCGVKKLFHKVSVKPGKPVWCGQLPAGGIVFALPGNPFSCLVTFMLFVDWYLAKSFRLAVPQPMVFPFNGIRQKKNKLDEFFPVRFSCSPPMLQAVNSNGSGDMRLGLSADGLALHPAEKAVLQYNELVTFLPF